MSWWTSSTTRTPGVTDGATRVRRLACVRGRVQGVWFRGSTQQEAQRLAIAGWVRNRPDGSVEAALEGSREAVEALLAWLRVGPRLAEVDSVEVREEPVQDERGFRVRGG